MIVLIISMIPGYKTCIIVCAYGNFRKNTSKCCAAYVMKDKYALVMTFLKFHFIFLYCSVFSNEERKLSCFGKNVKNNILNFPIILHNGHQQVSYKAHESPKLLYEFCCDACHFRNILMIFSSCRWNFEKKTQINKESCKRKI